MLKRIAAGLVATAAGISVLGAASAASASPEPEVGIASVSINPDPLVIKHGESGWLRVAVVTKNASKVRVSIRPVGVRTFADDSKEYTRDDWDRWNFSWKLGSSAPSGKWVAEVTAYSKSGKEAVSAESTFAVQHARPYKKDTDIVRFDAGPEPVRKGQRLTLSGKLVVEDRHHDRGYDDQVVKIYFRESRHGGWKYVTSTETNHRGYFKTSARAWRDGYWKAVYEGNRWARGSVSDADYVDVGMIHNRVPIPR
ncbi:hypothetical protein [Bailinhaonella thermotolerans]|uniref:Uncharacterized protein n=1 Tax=Bailinhaonella thermotolerans TaxID=1070861 RepID=A0A3A4BC12_9ACTN|nr:hypothetical protein [Bailinhaonella thermotolerans]RJL36063.1 hypothetical protein D5H75_04715 [Bailinhaonella thermotolerans]